MEKSIIVPKNINAMNALNLNESIDDQLIKLVINEDDFKKIWESGLFGSINEMVDSLIDLYEDEKIVDQTKIDKLLMSPILDKTKYNSKLHPIVDQIKGLFEEAKKRETGIFFYF
jgi:hypothetical protein